MSISTAAKVWFITGTSKGFGRIWAEAALGRGDKVVATARDRTSLSALSARHGSNVLSLALDVTDEAAVTSAVTQGMAHFGRLDVVVNNAGYGLFGTVEEVEARAQMETNFFGALWVTKAVIPVLREQRSGHIIQVSSIAGVSAFPTLGLYNASKWALEGLSQALALEVKEFGIKVTLIEPTGYSTDWGGRSASHAPRLSVYDGTRARLAAAFAAGQHSPGNPLATGPAILKIVDAQEPPTRVFFGAGLLEMMKVEYAGRIATWEKWNDLSIQAQGTPAAAK